MKRKRTVYLEDDLSRAMRAAAARTGKRDDQIVEDALRADAGLEVLERVGARSTSTEEDPLALADHESISAECERFSIPASSSLA